MRRRESRRESRPLVLQGRSPFIRIAMLPPFAATSRAHTETTRARHLAASTASTAVQEWGVGLASTPMRFRAGNRQSGSVAHTWPKRSRENLREDVVVASEPLNGAGSDKRRQRSPYGGGVWGTGGPEFESRRPDEKSPWSKGLFLHPCTRGRRPEGLAPAQPAPLPASRF